jgi:hypothetical protein
MSETSPSSSEPGFTRFRAAEVVPPVGGAPAGSDPASPVPPPLPPPPPGVAPREVVVAVQAPAGRPASPPVLPAGADRTEAWQLLVDWCVRSGLAGGGMLVRRDGTVVEIRGTPPVADASLLARRLCAALAAAREAGGREPVAAAIDLGSAWITGFPVAVVDGGELVAAVWGGAPLRGVIRTPLSRWLGESLASSAHAHDVP